MPQYSVLCYDKNGRTVECWILSMEDGESNQSKKRIIRETKKALAVMKYTLITPYDTPTQKKEDEAILAIMLANRCDDAEYMSYRLLPENDPRRTEVCPNWEGPI